MLKIILLVICLIMLSSCASLLAEAIISQAIHEISTPAGTATDIATEVLK